MRKNKREALHSQSASAALQIMKMLVVYTKCNYKSDTTCKFLNTECDGLLVIMATNSLESIGTTRRKHDYIS